MKIAVYCGAADGNKPIFKNCAIALGNWIAKNNYSLVFGGGKVGLMGILADTVNENNGQTIGVMPKFLKDREIAHSNLDELYVVETMSERKQKMLDLADVCIALPGGPGTLEEITEVVSWSRIGQNNNPCIFFNVDNYYQPIIQMYDSMVENGFLSVEDRQKMLFSTDFEEIEQFIKEFAAPELRSYK
ncbi:MAG: TIGR00730 family Rossman fold protein [Streptococcaceae bacterium]|jgi:uncharacterized protein (TIGR00730 family)|nr:TIGR00730 family Rossman fold protein [Streptococcaceae bacterium]